MISERLVLRGGLRALVLGVIVAAAARPATGGVIEPVTPTASQVRATGIVTRLIAKQHYLDAPLDDGLSSRTLDRYLESLDPGRSYFLASDVERLSRHRHRLDDALRQGRLEPAFEIFNLFRTRLAERGELALGQLDRRFDFSRDEDFQVDRSEAPWARDRAELDELWRRRVKNDLLNLRLAGRSESEALGVLRRRYEGLVRRAEQLNAEDAFQVFMNAYTGSIEPHTAYFSPRNSENFQIQLSLSLEGIGAALQSEDEYTVVQRIIPGGPASGSGQLQAGDRVTGVGQGRDGRIEDVVGWRLDDVVDLIRGRKGTTVRLEVLPKGASDGGARRVISLVRDRIRLEDQAAKKTVIEVSGRPGPTRRIGVIDIPTFYLDTAGRSRGDPEYRSTSRDVARLLGELMEVRVDGVVLDLRADGGGALTEAIDLTGLFIPTGPVVQVRDAEGKLQVLEDGDPDVTYDGPLAILVDRQSASASEIFAAAMQDYGRGIVIGEATFGKGTVQSLLELARFGRGGSSDLGQLKATVAQFFRVNGSSTQHRGVVPDVVLPGISDPAEEGERSLGNAIPWTSVEPARYRVSRDLSPYLPEVLARHRARVRSDPGFGWLEEEAALRQMALARSTTSLLEGKRRAEREREERGRLERENRFRASRGLPLKKVVDDPDPDATREEKETPPEEDIWLTEAAHVLADFIDVSQRSPDLRTAGSRALPHTPCLSGDCAERDWMR